MSLKDFFSKKPILDSTSVATVENNSELINEYSNSIERYIPEVDYSNPEEFVRFGLASDYYENSYTRILDYYPYDGSTKEKLEWENNCIDLDLYVLKNLWPKSTGYANFSSYEPILLSTDIGHINSEETAQEQIIFKTGPNVNNFYESSSNLVRISNFYIDKNKGNTVEFWLKKEGMISSTEYVQECILDMWPGQQNNRLRLSMYIGSVDDGDIDCYHNNIPSAAPSSGYAGITISYGSENSGTGIAYYNNYVVDSYPNYIILDNNWHHYAISLKYNSGDYITIKLYRDGTLVHTNNDLILASRVLLYTESYIGSIGSLYGEVEEDTVRYAGRLSGSLDEIRLWNVARTSEDIYKYYNFTLGGGTNTDDSNIDLGVYFKFNEGITTDDSIDSIVLDYSGRNSNGLWIGYQNSCRSTGSAIADSGASAFEISDPIIRPTHPSIVELKANLEASGSLYDDVNVNNIYNFVPNWITTDCENQENDTIRNILQTVATVLDEFHLKTEKIKDLKNINYIDNDYHKNNPYMDNVLLNKDFEISNLFLQSSLFEEINSKEETIAYEEKINNIKNFIYQNIYNNLTNIYKSKGTTQAIQKMMNSLGINSDLIKLNLYANNVTYDFKNANYENKIQKKKYLKFSNNNSGYVKSEEFSKFYNSMVQIELDVLFPKLRDTNSEYYSSNNILTASLCHLLDTSDNSHLSLYFVRENYNSKHGRFLLTSANASLELFTDTIYNVYDERRFSIFFGVKSDFYFSFYNTDNDNYKAFIHILGEKEEDYKEVLFDSSVDGGALALQLGKYSDEYSDFDISSCRLYMKNYDREEGLQKFKDINNYGSLYPHENSDFNGINNFTNDKSLIINWEFDLITGSDSSGHFDVLDFSSGSSHPYSQRIFAGEIYYNSNISGSGNAFEADSTSIVGTEYIYNSQQKLPENLSGDNMVDIVENDEYLNFKRDIRPISYIYSLERSYYQNISQEMINIFAGIVAFNNILGEPVQKYRREYKSLNKLRNSFFEKVQNIPDIEKYVNLYKWIDKSIEDVIKNLIPLSTNMIENNGIIIESHILERNKYQNKFTNYRDREPKILGNFSGAGKSKYFWDGKSSWWFANLAEKEENRIPIEISSDYIQNKNNIQIISITTNNKKNIVGIPSNISFFFKFKEE